MKGAVRENPESVALPNPVRDRHFQGREHLSALPSLPEIIIGTIVQGIDRDLLPAFSGQDDECRVISDRPGAFRHAADRL
jgi:hypothetical protein